MRTQVPEEYGLRRYCTHDGRTPCLTGAELPNRGVIDRGGGLEFSQGHG